MKIIDVRVDQIHFTSRMIRDGEFHSHPGAPHDAKQAMLTIVCDNGIEGYYFGPMVERVVLGGCKEILVGEDPLYRERIYRRLLQYQRLMTELNERTLCAIDCALWDIAGKAANLPVYKLLGAYRDKVPCYGSIMVGDDIKGGLDTPDAYAKYSVELVKKGYKALKLHTWMPPIIPEPSVDMDLAACRAVREAVGPDIPLMLDPYHYYSREEALRLAKGLEKLDFLWLEEPMDEHSEDSFVYLTSHTSLNICGPETAEGKYYTRANWIRNNAADIGRAGALTCGGITAVLKCVHLYEANGMSIEMHGNHIGNLHLLGAMGIDGKYFERGLLHPVLDYEKPSPWLNSIYDKMDENGDVIIPQAPGLGWDINWEYIKDNLVK